MVEEGLSKGEGGGDLLYRESSTIGATGLNGRVRDGNGWNPCAIATSQNQYAGKFSNIMPLKRGRTERVSSSIVTRVIVSNY